MEKELKALTDAIINASRYVFNGIRYDSGSHKKPLKKFEFNVIIKE